jgi:hypothetical protein
MATNASPGVYSNIIDLSSYVQQVPSTIGFVCALTKRGRDNQLVYLTSKQQLVTEWGNPDYQTYGKDFGQGENIAFNYLGESGGIYFMRCLPDDAKFANLIIKARLAETDSTAVVYVTYDSDLNDTIDINTALASDGSHPEIYPLAVLYPIGRGDYYNSISVRITKPANSPTPSLYVLDIYQKQPDGIDSIVESFNVSFDPTSIDNNGESNWIVYVLQSYSNLLRADMTCTAPAGEEDNRYAAGYDLLVRVYDRNVGNVTLSKPSIAALLFDDMQNFELWQNAEEEHVEGQPDYMAVATDAYGYTITGYLGSVVSGTEGTQVRIFKDRFYTERGWSGEFVNEFRDDKPGISYMIKRSNSTISEPFGVNVPLRKGSDGSLKDEFGGLNRDTAKDILIEGYTGGLRNPITCKDENSMKDKDNVYFSMVFDAGYPTDVKNAILDLVAVKPDSRLDCVAITDNGDNPKVGSIAEVRSAVKERYDRAYNNYYTAIYEPYSKVYDVFSGKDIWASPVYHMAYILPRNDRVSEVWFAAAGFTRGVVSGIKELRFNPNQNERDQLYLNQINPIVRFNQGYVVWGNLTSYTKPSVLNNLNVVRCILYIDRALKQYCRNYIFEQNDATTWGLIRSDVAAFLEDVKRRRGLYSYTLEVGSSDYERKLKTIHVNITLEPIAAVEKIVINFFVK